MTEKLDPEAKRGSLPIGGFSELSLSRPANLLVFFNRQSACDHAMSAREHQIFTQ
jgi:hypothetical protein